jgi:hypothetical protein
MELGRWGSVEVQDRGVRICRHACVHLGYNIVDDLIPAWDLLSEDGFSVHYLMIQLDQDDCSLWKLIRSDCMSSNSRRLSSVISINQSERVRTLYKTRGIGFNR